MDADLLTCTTAHANASGPADGQHRDPYMNSALQANCAKLQNVIQM